MSYLVDAQDLASSIAQGALDLVPSVGNTRETFATERPRAVVAQWAVSTSVDPI